MSAQQITEGDVVQLKSGGPLMTVIELNHTGRFFCQWFEGASVKQGFFPASALNKIVEDGEESHPFDYQ